MLVELALPRMGCRAQFASEQPSKAHAADADAISKKGFQVVSRGSGDGLQVQGCVTWFQNSTRSQEDGGNALKTWLIEKTLLADSSGCLGRNIFMEVSGTFAMKVER